MKYTHRYIARITLEAETPIFVGSGETSLLKNALVQKDHFGFPMIQGTSLAGVLRHALERNPKDDQAVDTWNSFFGFQKEKGTKEADKGVGSKVKIGSAYLVLDDGEIAEGFPLTPRQQELLNHFEELPARQHVRINDKGTHADKGLFDNEVVYKGCRFIFQIEVKGDDTDATEWEALLSQLKNPLFRIGQGTRNGYGKLSVHSCMAKTFNLREKKKEEEKEEENDFYKYLNFDSSFNSEKNNCLEERKSKLDYKGRALVKYQLDLKPDSFFIFGSGFEDEEVNNTPVYEEVVTYNGDAQQMTFKKRSVIPASSIKGAIRHRTCFHHNKLLKIFADEKAPSLHEQFVGVNNDAVYALFGAEARNNENNREGQLGKVIIDDTHFVGKEIEKIFNHVAIDRFTGGAIDGALFSEKVSQKEALKIDIWVDTEGVDDNIIHAFENALLDITKGLLPLGGMTTKGHGIFEGTLNKEKEPIKNYHHEKV